MSRIEHASRAALRALVTEAESRPLSWDDIDDGLRSPGMPEAVQKRPARSTMRRRPDRRGPAVVLLPGIMGSALSTDRDLWITTHRDELWVDVPDLVGGAFTKFELTSSGQAAAGARECYASSVLSRVLLLLNVYETTVNELSEHFTVYPVCYDWRQSIETSARAVRREIDRIAADHSDVSLVCHSMGGLVGLLAAFPAGGVPAPVRRLVLGAVPFLGAFAACEVLLGTFSVLEMLAKIDALHGPLHLGSVAATFPGTYDLLPKPQLALAGSVDARNPAHYTSTNITPARMNQGMVAEAKILNALTAAQAALGTDFQVLYGTGRDDTPTSFLAGAPSTVGRSSAGDGTVPVESATVNHSLSHRQDVGAIEHMAFYASPYVAWKTAELLVAPSGRGLVARAPSGAVQPSAVPKTVFEPVAARLRDLRNSGREAVLEDPDVRTKLNQAFGACAVRDPGSAAAAVARAVEALDLAAAGPVPAAPAAGAANLVSTRWTPVDTLPGSTAAVDWTVLVYMAGDDWNPNGIASFVDADLREISRGMDRVDARGKKVRVLVQCDRRRERYTERMVFDPGRGGDGVVVGRADRNLNTGDPEELVDFLLWGLPRAQGSRTMVVLWGHGAGYDDTDVYQPVGAGDDRLEAVLARQKLGFFRSTRRVRTQESLARRGFGYDDSSEDFLDISELRRALERCCRRSDTQDHGRYVVDVLAFDACLMACLEVAYELRDVANELVACQDEELGEGWNYARMLEALVAGEPAGAPGRLAKAYVDGYRNRMDAVCSVTRLGSVDSLVQQLAAWSEHIRSEDLVGRRGVMRVAWAQALCDVRRFPLGNPRAYADFADLIQRWSAALLYPNVEAWKEVHHRSEAVLALLAKAVKSESWGWPEHDEERAGPELRGARGLTIYAPHGGLGIRGLSRAAIRKYRALSFDEQVRWLSILRQGAASA